MLIESPINPTGREGREKEWIMFAKTKSFGPRIRLTKKQMQKLEAKLHAAGLQVAFDNCSTGSCYVEVSMPAWSKNIRGEWIVMGGDWFAKIRLSGHDEGRRTDSTHNVQGSKSECLAALDQWVDEIVAERSDEARAILAAPPQGEQ